MKQILAILIALCLATSALAFDFGGYSFNYGGGSWRCTDILPSPAFSPTSLAFGNHPTGTTEDSVVTLTNNGTGVLSAASLAVTGTSFSLQSTTCGSNPFDLAASANCTATVRFAPLTAGVKTGELALTYPNQVGSLTVGLSGTGTEDVNSKVVSTCYSYIESTTTATQTIMAIYNNSGTRISTGATTTIPTLPAWVAVAMDSSPELTQGGTYYIGVSANGYRKYKTETTPTYKNRSNATGTWPNIPSSINPSTDTESSSPEIAMYCTNSAGTLLLGNNNIANFPTTGSDASGSVSLYMEDGYVAQ